MMVIYHKKHRNEALVLSAWDKAKYIYATDVFMLPAVALGYNTQNKAYGFPLKRLI
jgi:hypothetical protein